MSGDRPVDCAAPHRGQGRRYLVQMRLTGASCKRAVPRWRASPSPASKRASCTEDAWGIFTRQGVERPADSSGVPVARTNPNLGMPASNFSVDTSKTRYPFDLVSMNTGSSHDRAYLSNQVSLRCTPSRELILRRRRISARREPTLMHKRQYPTRMSVLLENWHFAAFSFWSESQAATMCMHVTIARSPFFEHNG